MTKPFSNSPSFSLIFLDDFHNSDEMESRIYALEEKTRLQDMEIILLKSALSDVLSQLANQQNKMSNGSPAKTSTKKAGRR